MNALFGFIIWMQDVHRRFAVDTCDRHVYIGLGNFVIIFNDHVYNPVNSDGMFLTPFKRSRS